VSEQLVQSCYVKMEWLEVEPGTLDDESDALTV